MDGIDLALLLNRGVLGVFFFMTRARTLFDDARMEKLETVLCDCGYGRRRWLTWFVALVEVLAGAALIVGLASRVAAFSLFAVLLVAMHCTVGDRLMEKEVKSRWDACVHCLWMVEPSYFVMALVVMLAGAGRLSLDQLIW